MLFHSTVVWTFLENASVSLFGFKFKVVSLWSRTPSPFWAKQKYQHIRKWQVLTHKLNWRLEIWLWNFKTQQNRERFCTYMSMCDKHQQMDQMRFIWCQDTQTNTEHKQEMEPIHQIWAEHMRFTNSCSYLQCVVFFGVVYSVLIHWQKANILKCVYFLNPLAESWTFILDRTVLSHCDITFCMYSANNLTEISPLIKSNSMNAPPKKNCQTNDVVKWCVNVQGDISRASQRFRSESGFLKR